MTNIPQFDSAASTYNSFSTIQSRVGEQLLSLLPTQNVTTCLDFGCGTGKLTQKLCFPNRYVVGYDTSPKMIHIAAQSPQHIPASTTPMVWTSSLTTCEKHAPYSLIFSNTVLQWDKNLPQTLHWIHTHCSDHALISVFGPNTFCELSRVWPYPIAATQFHPLSTYETLLSSLFSSVTCTYQSYSISYKSLHHLLNTIKKTGTYTSTISGLLTPRLMNRISRDYRHAFGTFKATYEFALLSCRK